jgi:hypothetical protein
MHNQKINSFSIFSKKDKKIKTNKFQNYIYTNKQKQKITINNFV